MPRDGAASPIGGGAHRPKVWLLADRVNGVYDDLCQGIATAVSSEFETRIAYAAEEPDLQAWDFDLVMVCSWAEAWHKELVTDRSRVIKLLHSAAWRQCGASPQAPNGPLTPQEFASQHLADAGTLAATNHSVVKLIGAHRKVAHASEGVDCERFAASQDQTLRDASVPVRFGWADSGYTTDDNTTRNLLLSSAGDLDLSFAPNNQDAGTLAPFYRDLDVVLVTSSGESRSAPLLRGMASGCFVISTDPTVASDLIRNADNGLIVERTEEALRTAMQWCQANPQYVRRRGSQSAVAMQQERSWPAVAPQWLRLLRDAHRRQAGLPESTPPEAAPGSHPGAVLTPTAKHYADANKHDHPHHVGHHAAGDPPHDAAAAALAYYRCELLPILPDERNAQVLDVGCAHGSLLDFLHGEGFHNLTGLDKEESRQRHAQSRLHDRARIHHAEAVAWLGDHRDQFDLITVYDLLAQFSIPSAIDFAERVRLCLRPGGIAVFRTANMANVLGGYSRCQDLSNQSGFTEQSAMQLLHAAGFADIQLVLPDFSGEPHLHSGIVESRKFHEHLFAVQDRKKPLCFDKNLVIVGKRAAKQEPARAAHAYASIGSSNDR